MSRPAIEIETPEQTDGVPMSVRDGIVALDAAAEEADGTAALDDQVRLDLSGPAPSVRHLLARWDETDTVVGYGHADLRSGDMVSGHLLVGPEQRRRGVGTAVLGGLLDAAPALPLSVWAHGDIPAARAFAEHHGFESVRELRKMRRSLAAEIPAPAYESSLSVRTFVPSRDEQAWVAVNAAAFSHHPEQGRMTVDDVRQRIEQPWFDPAGFFLAERDGELVGYHWTKVHRSGGEEGGPIGEVYVLGVHPDAQGLGLGRALTLTGLQHLRDTGLNEVMLYVDGDNAPAVAVYERLGFATASVDVMYGRR